MRDASCGDRYLGLLDRALVGFEDDHDEVYQARHEAVEDLEKDSELLLRG